MNTISFKIDKESEEKLKKTTEYFKNNYPFKRVSKSDIIRMGIDQVWYYVLGKEEKK